MALDAGVDGFIDAPCTPAKLTECLERLMKEGKP